MSNQSVAETVAGLLFIRKYEAGFAQSIQALDAAVELLNEQEKEIHELQTKSHELQTVQTARIMSLEEIDGILSGSMESHNTIFWAESRSKTTCSFGVFQLDYSDDGDFEALLIGCS